MPKLKAGERRQSILETLARLLQEHHGEAITTARLARAVGVSEAALYRHFPSKAKMFDALIEFAETTVFARINRIAAEPGTAEQRAQQIVQLVLGFADKNPGIANVINGGVLVGETEYLRTRVALFYDRVETHLRQVLRENAEFGSGAADVAAILCTFIAGRIAHAVRSGFTRGALDGFADQWPRLRDGLFAVPAKVG